MKTNQLLLIPVFVCFLNFSATSQVSGTYRYLLNSTDQTTSGIDLRIAAYHTPVTGLMSGDQHYAVCTVSNSGDASFSTTFSIAFYLSMDDSLDESDILLDSDVVNGLSSQSSMDVFGDYTFPELEKGFYFLIYVLDANNDVEEDNEDNNIVATEFMLNYTEDIVDYRINEFHHWLSTNADTLSVMVDLSNHGTISPEKSTKIQFFLSNTVDPGDDSYLIYETDVPAMDKNYSATVAAKRRVPRLEYKYVVSVLDAENTIQDVVQENNLKALEIDYPEDFVTDIAVSSSMSDINVVAGDTLPSVFLLNNPGNFEVQDFLLDFYLSNDAL